LLLQQRVNFDYAASGCNCAFMMAWRAVWDNISQSAQ